MLNVPKINQRSAAEPVNVSEAVPPTMPSLDPMVVKLRKPIKTHAGETRELKFRDPIGADYIEIGELPFDLRGDETNRRLTVNFKIAAKWIARLTNIDEILVGQLSGDDWLDATGKVNAILMRVGVDDMGNSGG